MHYIIPWVQPLVSGSRTQSGQKADRKEVTLFKEQFLEDVRDALHHLYDPDRLRKSSLASLFGVGGRYDTPAALRRILTEVVEALEPNPNEPRQSHAWRMYDALLLRYVEQSSQQEVADQLSISPRQLRREERAALTALVDLLWERFDLDSRAPHDSDLEVQAEPVGADLSTITRELAWIKDAARESPTDTDQTLPAVLDLAQRLAEEHGTCLQIARADILPRLAVHPVAFRQIMLNLLSVAIPRASGGRLSVSIAPRDWQIETHIRCREYPSGPKPALEDETASLNMAQQLVDFCGGRLILSVDASCFDALLALPILEQLPVLVIEDNVDTLRLLQRYVAGTRYRLITTQDPEQAVSLAAQISPQIIVLDVMMPQMDGWEVLGRLRQHPLTSHLPIIVYTILSQRDLASLLGASAFIRKPVTQQAFLDALDQQIEWTASASR